MNPMIVYLLMLALTTSLDSMQKQDPKEIENLISQAATTLADKNFDLSIQQTTSNNADNSQNATSLPLAASALNYGGHGRRRRAAVGEAGSVARSIEI